MHKALRARLIVKLCGIQVHSSWTDSHLLTLQDGRQDPTPWWTNWGVAEELFLMGLSQVTSNFLGYILNLKSTGSCRKWGQHSLLTTANHLEINPWYKLHQLEGQLKKDAQRWECELSFLGGVKNEDCSPEDSPSDRSERLLQRGRRWRSKYVILAKGAFTRSNTYRSKGFLLATRSWCHHEGI